MDETKIYEGVTRAVIDRCVSGLKYIWPFKSKTKALTKEDLKQKVNILFVDDEVFNYIDLIKGAGWNANHVEDISSLDDEHLKRAHIVFLDYIGVGQKLAPTQQGIGLLKAIKQKYPQKVVIFYSGHAGFGLGDEFRLADDWIPKNADPYVFILKIEETAQKLPVNDLF
jgi:hypothetical protein